MSNLKRDIVRPYIPIQAESKVALYSVISHFVSVISHFMSLGVIDNADHNHGSFCKIIDPSATFQPSAIIVTFRLIQRNLALQWFS